MTWYTKSVSCTRTTDKQLFSDEALSFELSPSLCDNLTSSCFFRQRTQKLWRIEFLRLFAIFDKTSWVFNRCTFLPRKTRVSSFVQISPVVLRKWGLNPRPLCLHTQQRWFLILIFSEKVTIIIFVTVTNSQKVQDHDTLDCDQSTLEICSSNRSVQALIFDAHIIDNIADNLLLDCRACTANLRHSSQGFDEKCKAILFFWIYYKIKNAQKT